MSNCQKICQVYLQNMLRARPSQAPPRWPRGGDGGGEGEGQAGGGQWGPLCPLLPPVPPPPVSVLQRRPYPQANTWTHAPISAATRPVLRGRDPPRAARHPAFPAAALRGPGCDLTRFGPRSRITASRTCGRAAAPGPWGSAPPRGRPPPVSCGLGGDASRPLGVAPGRLRSTGSRSETGVSEFMPQALIEHLLSARHCSWCGEGTQTPCAGDFRREQMWEGSGGPASQRRAPV